MIKIKKGICVRLLYDSFQKIPPNTLVFIFSVEKILFNNDFVKNINFNFKIN